MKKISLYQGPIIHNFNGKPPKVAFYDNIASVSALSFTDQDADAEEIGGSRSGGVAGALGFCTGGSVSKQRKL